MAKRVPQSTLEHPFDRIRPMLRRNMRYEADLVDQLFNSSEKQLARVLLTISPFRQSRETRTGNSKISQEILAEMVGTTRSRVSLFMNRFRKMGFIKYNGELEIHSSLLNVVFNESSERPA
jgi:CRP/FNR family transcriptional regulator, cyclic AMP receptor protein